MNFNDDDIRLGIISVVFLVYFFISIYIAHLDGNVSRFYNINSLPMIMFMLLTFYIIGMQLFKKIKNLIFLNWIILTFMVSIVFLLFSVDVTNAFIPSLILKRCLIILIFIEVIMFRVIKLRNNETSVNPLELIISTLVPSTGLFIHFILTMIILGNFPS